MSYHILFSMLVIITATASYINHRFLKLPKTIGLTIVTLLISILIMVMLNYSPRFFMPIHTLLSGIDFKDTLLNGMLGYLLFAGALHVNVIDLRRQFLSVAYLASFGVVISTILTACALWAVAQILQFPIPITHCLIFGALISPTDPIAVLAVFKTTKSVPKKIKSRITGEALFNDAAGILLFVFLINIFSFHLEDITVTGVLIEIIHEAIGGIVAGWLLGMIASIFLVKVDDKEVTILITLGVASAGFIFSQYIGVSAPIAMVIAGLVVGSQCKKARFSKKTTNTVNDFWGLVEEVLNAFLFVLIGLEMLTIEFPTILIFIGIFAIIIVFIARYISVTIPIISKINASNRRFYFKENILMSWGGIRGGISIALALSIPGQNETIISITYVVVIISILLQGSTFKWAVNYLFPCNQATLPLTQTPKPIPKKS